MAEQKRICEPCVKHGHRLMRFLGRFGIVLILTVIVTILPSPEGLSFEGQKALAALVFTGSILALQPVSLPIAGLMIPLAQVALGVADTSQVFDTFSRPVIFLILGSLFLAEALRKYGLTRRLALRSIVSTGGGIRKVLLGLMLISALLSMWVENTATAAVLIPVALTIANEIKDEKISRQFLVLLVLGIAYSSSLGGMVTITGAASNAVAFGFLAEVRVWTFIDWMQYGLPIFFILFPITWYTLSHLVRVDVKQMDMNQAIKEVEKMGAMNQREKEILMTLIITAFLWITGSIIEPALNLPSTLLSPALVAVGAVSYLSLRGIINWEDVRGVSWGFLFIIGAGLSLGETLYRTGAIDWMSSMLGPVITQLPLLLSILLLVFMSALLTNIINNATVVAVFVPILISLSRVDPFFNSIQLALPVALATTFGYSLPSASGRMALISVTGIVNRKDMFRFGLIITVISSFILSLFFYILVILGMI